MAVRNILFFGNPLLSKPSEPVKEFGKALDPLVGDLRDTLMDVRKRHGIGRGIAAPQIGVPLRVINVVEDGVHTTYVNPKIAKMHTGLMRVWDSCFSYDLKFFVLVNRAKAIEVVYQTQEGEHKTGLFTGARADILQHEIDHLDGILSIQRAVLPEQRMSRAEWEKAGRPYIIG